MKLSPGYTSRLADIKIELGTLQTLLENSDASRSRRSITRILRDLKVIDGWLKRAEEAWQ